MKTIIVYDTWHNTVYEVAVKIAKEFNADIVHAKKNPDISK